MATQVFTLRDRWLQESEDKVETVALEQYYSALPRETAERLRDQQPATLMEAAGKVVEYQQNPFREIKEMKRAVKPVKAVKYSE